MVVSAIRISSGEAISIVSATTREVGGSTLLCASPASVDAAMLSCLSSGARGAWWEVECVPLPVEAPITVEAAVCCCWVPFLCLALGERFLYLPLLDGSMLPVLIFNCIHKHSGFSIKQITSLMHGTVTFYISVLFFGKFKSELLAVPFLVKQIILKGYFFHGVCPADVFLELGQSGEEELDHVHQRVLS